MYFVCFDIGIKNVKYGLLDDTGEILEKSCYTTPLENKEKFYDEIIEVTRGYCLKHEISGICISSPGIIDTKRGIIKVINGIPMLKGVNIKRELEELLEIDVSVENDARCAALGEVWKGSAKNYQDLIFLAVGTGIGGAVIKNRKIHHGSSYYSGEFGRFIITDKDGVLENWSSVVSIRNLIKRCAEILKVDRSTLCGKDIFDLAENGNSAIRVELEKFYHYLALGIYNLQFIYDPQAFIIAGGVSQREYLIENINQELMKIYEKTKMEKNISVIKRGELIGNANLVGALYNFLYA